MSDTPARQSSRHPRKSHIVGPARRDDGRTTTAYRAVAPHVCGQCGAEISPDALFSRRTASRVGASAINLTQAPVCVACRPLRVEGDASGTDDARHQGGEEKHHAR